MLIRDLLGFCFSRAAQSGSEPSPGFRFLGRCGPPAADATSQGDDCILRNRNDSLQTQRLPLPKGVARNIAAKKVYPHESANSIALKRLSDYYADSLLAG